MMVIRIVKPTTSWEYPQKDAEKHVQDIVDDIFRIFCQVSNFSILSLYIYIYINKLQPCKSVTKPREYQEKLKGRYQGGYHVYIYIYICIFLYNIHIQRHDLFTRWWQDFAQDHDEKNQWILQSNPTSWTNHFDGVASLP